MLAAWCGLLAALGGARAGAEPATTVAMAGEPALLSVPFLPQSELLCGGAAAAMVERWWGRRGVYAEDYAALVRPERGGILTTDLAAAVRRRGLAVETLAGTPDRVRSELDARTPVVALIEVAPARFHYVVIIGWAGGRVVFHDPARSPSRSMPENRFVAAWAASDRWAMVIRPGQGAAAAPPAPDSAATLPAPAAGDENTAARDLAGERFRQGRYREAAELSRDYLGRVPEDSLGWQLLASSRYLADDADGALAAWNRLGWPRVDLLTIEGSHAVRYRVMTDAMAAQPRAMLTPRGLALSRRRVAEIPALRGSAVRYRPIAGGEVELEAAVVERPVLESPLPLVAVAAVRALGQEEARLDVASPTGAGELWSAGARWALGRPGATISLDAPVRLGVPGVFSVSGEWLRTSFALDTAAAPHLEERRSGAASMSAWLTPWLRPSIGARFDHWTSGATYMSAGLGGELRAAGDRLVVRAAGARDFSLTDRPGYWTGGVSARWASSIGLAHPGWSLRAGWDGASAGAPLAAYPIAGALVAWAVPLRAHRQLDGGNIVAGYAGRSLLSGTIAADIPVGSLGPVLLALGGFLDAARVAAPADGSLRSRSYADAGGGVRVALAGGRLGVLRIDLATGLSDRATAFTVGVHRSWPLAGREDR